MLQFARLGPKINNLISGPKNLGWRCHVNSLVAKKEFPFFLSLILVEPAMMRYMVLIMLKICELMTFKTLHCICYVWRLSVIVLLITKPVQLNSMGLMYLTWIWKPDAKLQRYKYLQKVCFNNMSMILQFICTAKLIHRQKKV